MKKAISKLHLWLGLTSGLVVFIISITGCIYVFEDELKSIFYKDKLYVEVPNNASKKPISELMEIAQKTLGEEHPIQLIKIPTDANRSYLFRPKLERNKNALTYFGEYEYYRMLYLNPYTGEVIENENAKYEFFTIVLRLHLNLLLKKEIGHYIVGTSVLIFVFMIVSGIVLWWPKNKAALKQRLSFLWKKSTKWKRKNYDLHNILGFYSSFLVLIIALTGLTWSFDWVENSIQFVANGGKTEKNKTIESDTTQTVTKPFKADALFHNALKENPDAKVVSIIFPEKRKNTLNLYIYKDEQLSHNRKLLQYDQFSYQLLKTNTFEKKNTGEKLKALNYDIHVGRILSFPGKILAFILSLICASLPITGFYIWWGRNNKKKKTTAAITLNKATNDNRKDFEQKTISI